MKPAKKPRRFPVSRLFPVFLTVYLTFSVITLNVRGQQSDLYNTSSLRLNEVNISAERHFLRHFSSTTNVKWFLENHHYVAICKEGDSTDRVYYKLNGNFEYCIKYFLADAMDGYLKSRILKRYPGCKIMIITELTNLEKEELYIRIKDGDFIRTLRWSEEGFEVTENIRDAGV
jgi:hypothetical protein